MYKGNYNLFVFIAVLILAAVPAFWQLGYLPIQLWDESRLAMNAFEMNRSGEWLITTFDGEPDLWNTKPPLMIWLQVLCIKLNGLNELSLRIPSAIAAMGTFAVLYWFAAYKLRNRLLGVVACFILITAPGYIGLHRTRTGDYDALLVFFTTAFCIYYYLYDTEGKKKYFYYFLLCLLGGAMTKGIAAVIFLPPMLAFTLYNRGLSNINKRHIYMLVISFAVVMTGYYLLREQSMPGYLHAVLFNDVTGRFGNPVSPDSNDVLYYVKRMIGGNFWYWCWLLPVAIVYAFVLKESGLKKLAVYSLLLGAFYFSIVSLSRTKNDWYDMPVYPFISILVAILVAHIISWLASRIGHSSVIKVAAIIALFTLPYYSILQHVKNERLGNVENDSIAFYMKGLLHSNKPAPPYAVVWNGYHADLYWYLKILRQQGPAREVKTAVYQELKPGMQIMSFQQEVQQYIETHYAYKIMGQHETILFYKIGN